jgi:hypothetical protein
MTLDKAIEILTDHLHGGPTPSASDLRAAVKLGLEGLKVYKAIGERFPHIARVLIVSTLSGETKR